MLLLQLMNEVDIIAMSHEQKEVLPAEHIIAIESWKYFSVSDILL